MARVESYDKEYTNLFLAITNFKVTGLIVSAV
jgi:hypothetical protein